MKRKQGKKTIKVAEKLNKLEWARRWMLPFCFPSEAVGLRFSEVRERWAGNQTNIGTVSRATDIGETPERRDGAHMGLPKRI